MSTIISEESTLLQGGQASVVVATNDGIKTNSASRSHKFFVIDGRTIVGAITDNFIDSVKRHRHDVYGIRLGGSKIDEESVALITEQLITHLPYMEFYDCSYLSMSTHTQIQLCRLLNPLTLGYCPILRLHLVNCGLGFKGGRLVFEALASNVTMQEIHVGGNNFGDVIAPYVVQFLANMDNTLRVFSIDHNGITEKGMEDMALTIGAHNHLEEIHFDGNPIGSEGAELLMNAVWNTKLNYISLSKCNISECGWASVLVYMSCLETLVLSCNDIDGAGLQDLCEGADRCCSIRHLDVSYNVFNGPQASAIGLLIKHHKGLVTLNLAGVPLSQEMVNNIQLGILGNPTLRVLDLSWCQMSLDLVKPLVVALAHNALLDLKLDYNPILPEIQEAPRSCIIYRNERRLVEKQWAEKKNKAVEANKVIEIILATSNIETGMEDVSKLDFAFMNPLHAEAASAIWRKRRFLEIGDAKKAFGIVKNISEGKNSASDSQSDIQKTAEQVRMENLEQRQVDDGAMKVHIDPSYAAVKIQKEQDKATSAMILSNTENEKCVLSVSYGRQTEYIGTIEVTDQMTYFEARPLLQPLFREYFNTEDEDFIESVMKFKILDGSGNIIPPEAEKVRIAWTELSMAGLYMNLQPANWVYIPPGEDD